ncbi:MAG: membrane protein [Candidatus Izimaplasma sp.]|nr:membrane protein [Candidatus Izimaplasma bacterium]
MTEFKTDLKRLPILLLGFVCLAIGIMLMRRSDLGMAPWGVLHDGLTVVTPLSFGVITILLGFIIMVFSVVLLKTKIGIGTILNVVFVGLLIDLSAELFTYHPKQIETQLIVLILGILVMTFGRSLYISARLGSGPRDGVFVGLSRITKIDVKYVKPTIEFTVLFIGYLLGGVVGIGTIIAVISTGYLVQMFMAIMHFDPKEEQQHNLFGYTNNKR